MEFLRKLFSGKKEKQPDIARGTAPVQSQEEQDATRVRMENEMTSQRERREAKDSKE